jgi:hypothetical protein
LPLDAAIGLVAHHVTTKIKYLTIGNSQTIAHHLFQSGDDRRWVFILSTFCLGTVMEPVCQVLINGLLVVEILKDSRVDLLQGELRIELSDFLGGMSLVDVGIENRFNPYAGVFKADIIVP